MVGKRGYWYSYEWIHRKWHAFSKEMYKFGESVTAVEFELIHGIREMRERLDYMNWRMMGACLHAIRTGLVDRQAVLVRF